MKNNVSNESDESYSTSTAGQVQDAPDDDHWGFWWHPEELEQFPSHVKEIADLCWSRTGVGDIRISKDLLKDEDFHILVIDDHMLDDRWVIVFPTDIVKMRASSFKHITSLVASAEADDMEDGLLSITYSLTRDELIEYPDLSDLEVWDKCMTIVEEAMRAGDQEV